MFLYRKPDEIKDTPNPIFAGGEAIRPIIDRIHLWGQNFTPILIHGEAGTGVDALARYIHSTGPNKTSPFITVDCQSLTEKRWQDIVDNTASPVNGKGCTLYFHNAHTLTPAMQEVIDMYIGDTLLLNRHHVISSSLCDIPASVAQGSFLYSLYLKLCGITVHMPSLNECPDDIPRLRAFLSASTT